MGRKIDKTGKEKEREGGSQRKREEAKEIREGRS